MTVFNGYISMPVARVDSGRDDDQQNRKEKQKELDRQLPRMRLAERKNSEKLLEGAMQAGTRSKMPQELSSLPTPATVKHKQVTDEKNNHSAERQELDDRSVEIKITHDQKKTDSRNQQLLQDLDNIFSRREYVPSLPDILNFLQKTEKNYQFNRNKESIAVPKCDDELHTKQSDAYQEDILCTLDFLSGYVSNFAAMPAICSEITGLIESLRQQVAIRGAESNASINLQQEGLVQPIGDPGTTCVVLKDAAGHQKLVIEVSESAVQKAAMSPRRSVTEDETSRQSAEPTDNTLPLIVQRSV